MFFCCYIWSHVCFRYTINDRNLGRLPSRITSTYNTELQLWKVRCKGCVCNTNLLDFEFLMQFCVKCLSVWLSQIVFFLDGALFCPEPECRSRWDAQEAGNRDCEEQYWMDATEQGGDPGLAGEQCAGRLQHLNRFSHVPLNLSMNCSGQLENETLAKSHN